METIILITGAIMYAVGVYTGRNWNKVTKE